MQNQKFRVGDYFYYHDHDWGQWVLGEIIQVAGWITFRIVAEHRWGNSSERQMMRAGSIVGIRCIVGTLDELKARVI